MNKEAAQNMFARDFRETASSRLKLCFEAGAEAISRLEQ